jgi:endo-beta-N-acetylglucosaminidase D
MSVMTEANKEWRKFIDILEIHDTETYRNLWLKKTVAQVVSGDYPAWQNLVQKAFFNGYEAGFTNRLFKGDINDD